MRIAWPRSIALVLALVTVGCGKGKASHAEGGVDAGDAAGDAGGASDAGSDVGDAGDDVSDVGDAGSDVADAGADIGDAPGDAEPDTADAGDAATPSCLPVSDAAISSPDAGLRLIADSVAGFSGTQGACAWSYGYQVPATDNAFHPMTEWDDPERIWWVMRGTYWTLVSADAQHPNGTVTTGGRSPVEQWSVRRWTSPVTGTITISGFVAKGQAGGNGVEARIVVDGLTKYSLTLDGADTAGTSFAIAAPVVVGSYVDFVVDPHQSQDSTDTTTFTARIWM